MVDEAKWRHLVGQVDAAIERTFGRNAVASQARDRAVALIDAGRNLDALEELHQVKANSFTANALRGSLLAMLSIAELFLRLRLPSAAKAHALGASMIACRDRDESLKDLIPTGLLLAAEADFVTGAWCGATELVALAMAAEYEFNSSPEFEQEDGIDPSILKLAYITSCAKRVSPELAAQVSQVLSQFAIEDVIEEIASGDSFTLETWHDFLPNHLLGRPFSDLGRERQMRFDALGLQWILEFKNNLETVRIAERFAAAIQCVLVALAREDLCILPTIIRVRVEAKKQANQSKRAGITSIPSNGGRSWVIRLTSANDANSIDPDQLNAELLGAIGAILLETSLMPHDQFFAAIERAATRGLSHKLSLPRPYDEIASYFGDPKGSFSCDEFNTPWDSLGTSIGAHPEIQWRDDLGPTYSVTKAQSYLQDRYSNLERNMTFTVKRLLKSEEFPRLLSAVRASGWLDWHILTAIFNVALNFRISRRFGSWSTDETRQFVAISATEHESKDAQEVPVNEFTLESMDRARRISMLASLTPWGLELHQHTPDIEAIERFLAKRYRYWDEDYPHNDPFQFRAETTGGAHSVGS